jgi:hypothetical protein
VCIELNSDVRLIASELDSMVQLSSPQLLNILTPIERCVGQGVSQTHLVREHDDRYTSKMALSSLGLKVLHTVQCVVGSVHSDED